MVTHGKLLAHYGNVIWLNANMRTDASTKRKHASPPLEFELGDSVGCLSTFAYCVLPDCYIYKS